MRTITILSTSKGSPITLNSEATSWGQLKDSLTREFPDVEKMRATVKETKNDLTLAEATLPEGDFTVYLTPQKIKGGGKLSATKLVTILAEAQLEMWQSILDSIQDGDDFEEEEEEDDEDFEDEDDEESIDSDDLAEMRRIQNGY